MSLPNILSNALDKVLPASRATYTAPAAPVAPAVIPKADPNAPVPVPAGWRQAFLDAYERYPNLPKGLVESVVMMESSMGKNRSNATSDYGTYGYLGGHTKTGHFADTLKTTAKDPELAARYKILERDQAGKYKITGIDQLATPYSAIQATASVLAKGSANHPYLANDPSDLYFKHYNGNPAVDTPDRRSTFQKNIQFYSGMGTSAVPKAQNSIKIKP